MEEQYDDIKPPLNFNDRMTNPMTQWKWEAATCVTKADIERGIRFGVIMYPDGRKVSFTR